MRNTHQKWARYPEQSKDWWKATLSCRQDNKITNSRYLPGIITAPPFPNYIKNIEREPPVKFRSKTTTQNIFMIITTYLLISPKLRGIINTETSLMILNQNGQIICLSRNKKVEGSTLNIYKSPTLLSRRIRGVYTINPLKKLSRTPCTLKNLILSLQSFLREEPFHLLNRENA